jgi:hypothetical protein
MGKHQRCQVSKWMRFDPEDKTTWPLADHAKALPDHLASTMYVAIWCGNVGFTGCFQTSTRPTKYWWVVDEHYGDLVYPIKSTIYWFPLPQEVPGE